MDDRRLCVLNAGSSSLKFAVYQVVEGDVRRGLSGEVERIGGEGHLIVTAADGKVTHDEQLPATDHAAALAALAALPDGPLHTKGLIGFGHRVVHGGPDLAAPVLVDAATLARINALSPLAPLHNPPAVAVLQTIAHLFPTVPQVACFDTAFHRSHPAVADRFAIPDALYREGVRRYGFHGLSYEYIAGVLAVDSSMTFTALDGLPMGTRPGSLDAGVILYLQQQKGWTVDQVEHFLYADCGLKGLSGVSNDMRVLLASEAPLARLAVEHFVFHVARTAASLAASMGGIDALVFTAGIGERSPEIRNRVLHRLSWLGFSLDEAANQAGGPLLTRADSTRPAYVIPTDEEVVIARHTAALIAQA
jgi:acetate kinase